MAVSGDVTIAQDGGQSNVKLHPYLITLVRWCVSCFWSTATVLLHRLIIAPLPSITGPKLLSRPSPKPRAAGRDHLHPEPRVECVVLHEPASHNLDVIFVHGLYGSLGNTWRQGDWRSKYKIEPDKVPLRTHNTPCNCRVNENNMHTTFINEDDYFTTNLNETEVTITDLNQRLLKKIIPNENSLITEQFYNNTLLDKVGNYETQAEFIQELFRKNKSCDKINGCENICKCNIALNETELNGNECKCNITLNETELNGNKCKCRLNDSRLCEIGCGCICEECYSPCWPKDWIKVDFPGARVISINYTSDPYLWRPLWIRGNKRLRLHERAEQMTKQLLALGVGEKPVIWVGHSKGGLFIKQIYCEAYEAYLQINKEISRNTTDDVNFDVNTIDNSTDNVEVNHNNTIDCNEIVFDNTTSENSEDREYEYTRALLWKNSVGFMFYSVPHRGSPLADIKTPITSRSIELLEISKDCSLVLSLQERWLKATASSRPVVRGLVETCRTLMSVLWLRIVSVDSADAGIGSLAGVSVDHREICKPSSRKCYLYTELTKLIRVALNKCQCQ